MLFLCGCTTAARVCALVRLIELWLERTISRLLTRHKLRLHEIAAAHNFTEVLSYFCPHFSLAFSPLHRFNTQTRHQRDKAGRATAPWADESNLTVDCLRAQGQLYRMGTSTF